MKIVLDGQDLIILHKLFILLDLRQQFLFFGQFSKLWKFDRSLIQGLNVFNLASFFLRYASHWAGQG